MSWGDFKTQNQFHSTSWCSRTMAVRSQWTRLIVHCENVIFLRIDWHYLLHETFHRLLLWDLLDIQMHYPRTRREGRESEQTLNNIWCWHKSDEDSSRDETKDNESHFLSWQCHYRLKWENSNVQRLEYWNSVWYRRCLGGWWLRTISMSFEFLLIKFWYWFQYISINKSITKC